MERRQVSRVLISVSDKSRLTDFTTELDSLGIEIVSTGGTAKVIKENGINVIPVEDVTNFPEMMGGRVKTLHPLIFGGILARDSDSEDIEKHQINLFDMIVCNLYPFKEAVSKGVNLDSLIEKIDIGGPSLLRAAAKNHSRVAVVSDPEDYAWIIDGLRMDYVWIMHGLYMDYLRIIRGCSLDYPRIIHGLYMDNQWIVHG